LFYFSGHGKQDEQGMHYALYETDVSKVNTTSLNNSELDDIVRKCSPKLYVKIIDACQSGVSYIKGVEEIDEEPKNIESKGFENCIFIYSSLKSQSSYSGNPYSQFTQAIIDAIESVSAPVVKFTDIQNYLSDVFTSPDRNQTPYFSTQCDGTEVFCEKKPEVIVFFEKLHSSSTMVDVSSQSTIDVIKAYLGKCRNDSDVKIIMENIQETLEKWELNHEYLNEFYTNKFSTSLPYEYHKYHEDSSLIKMLHANTKKENLFVEIEYTSVKKQNPLMDSIFSSFQEVPISFNSLANQLPSVFSIHLQASDANLPDYVIPFIFVYSPIFFYVFTCTKQFVRKGWKEYEAGRHTKYVYSKFEYSSFDKTTWNSYLTKRLKEAIDFIERTLLEFIEVK